MKTLITALLIVVLSGCTAFKKVSSETDLYVRGKKITEIELQYITILYDEVSSNKIEWKIILYADLGGTKKEMRKSFVTDQNGNILIFNTVTHALNYLYDHGWKKDGIINNGILLTRI